jgi:hypothetical protein
MDNRKREFDVKIKLGQTQEVHFKNSTEWGAGKVSEVTLHNLTIPDMENIIYTMMEMLGNEEVARIVREA